MDRRSIVDIIAFALIAAAAFGSGRYCWNTLTHRITPKLATWLIFLVGSLLSLASYRAHVHQGTSFVSNIANYIDAVTLVAIVASVLISARHERDRLQLNCFDLWCLASAALIAFLWIVTGASLLANLLLQVLMCVGYFPTLKHLFKEKRNTEPFDSWLASLGIATLALVPPLLALPRDWLGVVYTGRGVTCVVITLFVMRYYHYREDLSVGPR
jgi:ABC-type xylose transport system permease subunit